MYVYIKSEDQLWTVGHYDGMGKFHPESDHSTPQAAADRVVLLNGGKIALDIATSASVQEAAKALMVDIEGMHDAKKLSLDKIRTARKDLSDSLRTFADAIIGELVKRTIAEEIVKYVKDNPDKFKKAIGL